MKNVNQGIKIQFFAGWDDITKDHAQAFEGTNMGESVKSLQAKLGELGYDVLFNKKDKAEFVPSGRLHEVTGQRDQFKSQVEEANRKLGELQKAATGNEALQKQLQDLMDQNTNLLKDLESTKINTALMLAATDAINPQDLLVFINRENVKINSKGEVVGADSEIARLKQEKAYLFQDGTDSKKKKGGSDPNGDKSDPKTTGMNSMIRRAAGRL